MCACLMCLTFHAFIAFPDNLHLNDNIMGSMPGIFNSIGVYTLITNSENNKNNKKAKPNPHRKWNINNLDYFML